MSEAVQPVLNAALFARLGTVFGYVSVSKPGACRSERRRPDPTRTGRVRIERIDGGEQYVVSCPFCRDDYGRLFVSHAYATAGRESKFWNCFNERCQAAPGNRERFAAMLAGVGPAPAVPPSEESRDPAPPLWPAAAVRVDALPPGHPTACYLAARGFDVEELSREWNVHFLGEPTGWRSCPGGRILVPVHAPEPDLRGGPPREAYVGYQARIVPGVRPSSHPEAKYLTATGLRVGSLFYGLAQAARAAGPVVVMEGVADAWAYGPGALGAFGKAISPRKAELLARFMPGRDVVVLLDADAAADADAAVATLRCALPGRRVVRGALPAGRKDPGECGREELHEAVTRALSATVAVPAAVPAAVEVGAVVRPRGRGAAVAYGGAGPAAAAAVARGESVLRAVRLTAPDGRSVETREVQGAMAACGDARRIYPDAVLAGVVERLYGLPLADGIDCGRTAAWLLGREYAFLAEPGRGAEIAAAFADGEVGGGLEAGSQADRYVDVARPLAALTADMIAAGVPVDRDALARLEGGSLRDHERHALAALRRFLTPAGRVHPNLDPLGARTGRFSCSDPALQCLPKSLRAVIAATPGRVMIDADFRQFELRVAAGLSGDPDLIAALSDPGRDVYEESCSRAINDDRAPRDARRAAKALVQATLNGGGGGANNAASAGVAPAEAEALVRSFRRRYPRLAGWIEANRPVLKGLVQAAGAEVFGRALLQAAGVRAGGFAPLLPMHDGLLGEADEADAGAAADALRRALEAEPFRGVPLPVRVGVGRTWADAAG